MAVPAGFTVEFDGLLEALEQESAVSVRFNASKCCGVLPGGDAVPWCHLGRYLSGRIPFTFDPALHQGLYYVQDASSMIYHYIVSLLADSGSPVCYLDACAAPGGKTTAAIDALPEGSLVVANEYVPLRAGILRENLAKWGCPAVIVSKGDTARFCKLSDEFDIIAADVPCSGEGMFRKDAEAVAQWSPALVEECAARQREIVGNLWPALRDGGYFIYSTCTFNRRENEDIVAWMVSELGAEPVDLPFPEEWNVVERDGCRHFLPGRVRGEGLTVAVLRKPGYAALKVPRQATMPKTAATVRDCMMWIESPERFRWIVEGDTVAAFPAGHDVARILKTLDVVSAGIEMAHIKGRDLIPAQPLALSTALSTDAFPRYEVDYATAIAYLRREAVVLDDAPSGYVLLTYKATPLGFVKNLGRRANNLYPQQWRILSSHLPEEVPNVFDRCL